MAAALNQLLRQGEATKPLSSRQKVAAHGDFAYTYR
jgi:hypothetical protein